MSIFIEANPFKQHIRIVCLQFALHVYSIVLKFVLAAYHLATYLVKFYLFNT